MTAVLRDERGDAIPLPVDRWRQGADDAELAVLADLPDPILDVGCGPGRIAAALAATGRPALGIDPSPVAADEAVRRGAHVLCRSVFDPLPGERRWGATLLLDGNVGIGGDPVALLARCAALLRVGGHLVVEVEPPGTPSERLVVRVERPGRESGPWFPWARVGVDDVADLARTAGLVPLGCDVADDRWFARAVKP